MPIPGLLSGLEEGLAGEVAKQRTEQRAREDREFTQNLQILQQLRDDPRTTPEMYQRVLQDTLKVHAGMGAQRKPKSGIKGFLGQTETGPYHSEILDQLASGSIPVFQDQAAFDQARTGTSQDLRTHLAQSVSGQPGASQGAPAPAVAPPPMTAPPDGSIPPLGDQTSYVSAFHAKNPDTPISGQANSATPAVAPAPQGPVPSPPGTGHMASAASGVASSLQANGPVLPTPPNAAQIMAQSKGSPSAFFNPDQMAQMKASADTQSIPYQAKADFDALVAAGMDPHMATLAVARKLTGFQGGMSSGEGPWYVGPDQKAFKSILQKDNYGNFQHVHPQTGQVLGPEYNQVDPSANQIVVDRNGVARVVSKVGGNASAPISDTTGNTDLAKPYTPPPAFSGTATILGDNNQPVPVGIPRQGGPVVPLTVRPGSTSQGVPPPPAPGQRPNAANATAVPATKYEPQKPIGEGAANTLTSVGVVEATAKRALDVINQLEQQGTDMSSPIGQTIDKWFYSHGWKPSDLEAQLFQNVGANEANALKTVMGGRPNMKLIDILQMHTAQPGDSLELLKEKLTGLLRISDDMKKSVTAADSTYRARPYQGGTTPGQSVAPPPPRWSNSAGR